MRQLQILLVTLSSLCCAGASTIQFPDLNGVDSIVVQQFPGLDIEEESFEFYAPKLKYEGEKLGLFVYISSSDEFKLPRSWKKVCKEFRLALIAPLKVGNRQLVGRRKGVVALGTLRALAEGTYDRERVYLVGYSGGGRIASRVIFHFPEYFAGALGISGFDYNRPISFPSCPKDDNYGYYPFTNPEKEAKLKTRKLAVITGPMDFRYCFLKDIVNIGYAPAGYQIRLLDYPKLGHKLAGYRELKDAFDYFESE